MSEPVVTMRHVRQAKLCAKGVRGWFAGQPGLSWREFVTNGLPVSVVEATGDPLAARVAACAREEAAHGR